MAAGQDEGLTSASIDGALYLFAEEKRGDRQTREALFCTFNADLAFFERTVLGVTQSTGAGSTVVGDARISAPELRLPAMLASVTCTVSLPPLRALPFIRR